MRLRNYMEDAVRSILENMLEKKSYTGCKCSRCRLDIMAYALNQLPPKYVVTRKGETFTRISELASQFETDVVVALSKAIRQVGKNLRH